MLGTGGYRYVPLMIKARMGKAQGSISRHGSPRTKLRGQEAFLGGVDLRQQVTVAKQTTGEALGSRGLRGGIVLDASGTRALQWKPPPPHAKDPDLLLLPASGGQASVGA